MGSYRLGRGEASSIWVGLDVHLKRWHVTVLMGDEVVLSSSIDGSWMALRKLLSRWAPSRVLVAYEAGFSGFWLHDAVVEWGAKCMVVPPTLIPTETGNRVKTDRRDSLKLALLLSRGLLRQVWVPDFQLRLDREVVRQRRRLVADRRRVQCQLKGLLYWHGFTVPSSGRWTKAFLDNLRAVRFAHSLMQSNFTHCLLRYEQVTEWVRQQTQLVKQLAASAHYASQVSLLESIPGIGIITAMELLTELGDMSRFRRADHLAAYVGLTPSQYSSGERVRLGHITRGGKASLRSMLVEAAWIAIRRDYRLATVFNRLKPRTGSKRAIVAVARRLLMAARAVLISQQKYRILPMING